MGLGVALYAVQRTLTWQRARSRSNEGINELEPAVIPAPALDLTSNPHVSGQSPKLHAESGPHVCITICR